ncbi:hypothetical protein [Janthinobacterium sp. PAMC25594]|uniref:hypothetical protein n=1 Tax=Janthinobacterium sp. PAMC25594 TaxID=2861284 RepID=UPI001C63557E|nr:hypothetical protein [Janthinobacterium sp. PAMC25594]QYG08046.1 hypothetical protein KY494_04400 [Janthinobacterium sp. PAMC25594]
MSVVLNDRDAMLQGTIPRNIDPSAGKALILQADTQAFRVTETGIGSPEAIILRAQLIGIPGVVIWSATEGSELTGTGNARSLAFTAMGASSVTVTAQISHEGVTYTQSRVISKAFDGVTGAAGSKTATAYLYQWAATAPAVPSGVTKYTWATGINSTYSVSDGWSVSVPANPGTPGLQLFTATRVLSVAGDTATSTVGYANAAIASIAVNGAVGPQGVAGVKSGTARAYQWATSAPTITGSAIWTWATASYNTVPVTGWSATKPAAPALGYTLYEGAVNLVDGAGTTTSPINWSTATVAAIGYAGNNGTNGASVAIAYTLADAFTLNLTPVSVSRAGTAYPATGTWDETRAWVAQPTTAPAAGQAWFQSVGIYDGTNTVWGVPYLSSLKVGSLSALSANFGNMTAGTITGVTILGTTITGGVIRTAASGQRITINESANNSITLYGDAGGGVEKLLTLGLSNPVALLAVGSYSSGNAVPAIRGYSASGIGIEARSTSNQALFAASTSSYGVLALSTNGIAIQANSTNREGIQAFGGTVGVVGIGATYDFYAGGGGVNYGPFTGGHDGLALLDFKPVQGDILVDEEIACYAGISNTIAINALSSAPMQKNVIGVFVAQRPLDPQNPPVALKGIVGLAFMAEIYKSITLNAVGEGQINVCGEGGDIKAGDYITTSSMPGKGMRQADDVLHSYTVAKAREPISFNTPSETRLIACTYHCG